jgi:hypothetical protein
MPLDPNIALSYKPVGLDIAGAMQAANERKLMQSRNALAGTQQAAAQDELNNALAARRYAGGADLSDPQNAMRLLGYGKEGADMFQSLQAGRASSAAARKSQLEASGVKAGQYRQALAFVDSPNAAMEWLQMHHDDPDMQDSPVARMPLDVALSRIPQDPAGFQQWKQQAALGIDEYIKRNTLTAEQKKPKLEEFGGYKQAVDANAVPFGPKYTVTRSPNSQVTNINLPALENAEQKGQGELNVETYKGIQGKANLARKTAPAIDTALAVLDKGFGTGTGTATTAKIAGALSALGIPEATDYANDAAVFQATVQQTVLDRQFEQKGPQTEADAARITQTAANLGNPADANRFLLNIAKAQAKRDIAQQRFFANWFSTKNTYRGAEEAWFDGEGGKSLFADPTLSKYAPKEERPAAAPATTTAATPVTPPKIGTVRNGYKFKGGNPGVSTNWEKI